MHILFFKIYKRGLKHEKSMPLPKYVTQYGPGSGVPYSNLTTLIVRATIFQEIGWAALCVEPAVCSSYQYIDTPKTQIQNLALSWLGTGTSIKSGDVRLLVYCHSNN